MPTLYVYDPSARAFRPHALSRDMQMPHITRFAFPLSDFLGRCETGVCWTDLRALQSLDELCLLFGRPLTIERAFARAGARGYAERTQHCTGTAFDIGAGLSPDERERLRVLALRHGLFAYAEPAFLSGAVAHLSRFACCPRRLSEGDAGVFVFALQDALLAAGAYRGALTGVLNRETLLALRRIGAIGPDQRGVDRSALLMPRGKEALRG